MGLVKDLEKITGYEIELISNPFRYYRKLARTFDITSVSPDGVPYLTVTGWVSHRDRRIIVFDPLRRGRILILLHEAGHALGHRHTNEKSHVMYPSRFGRGYNGLHEMFPSWFTYKYFHSELKCI